MDFNDKDGRQSVFSRRPCPAPQKSGQLALMTYSHRKPARLAARLLMKMRGEVALGPTGAEELGKEKTLASGVQYLVQILLPTARELRTLMVFLELLARNNAARAADVVCQRVKALGRSASLLDRDEEVYLTKEALLERKLHHGERAAQWKGLGRGETKGEKGRGKGKNNGEDQKGRGKTGKEDK